MLFLRAIIAKKQIVIEGGTAMVNIDFSKTTGKIKPMHAVNNGPIIGGDDMIRENFNDFKEAEIPYVRNHDASFCAEYGGEHTVDVHAIFPDFDRDVDDEDAYDFTYTDIYTENILKTGAEVFYRLGSKIEHGPKKYGTLMPKDFNKWARICEHIIRHYNEGWANGFEWNIKYWEIWNEADGIKETGNQPCWSGTPEQFYEMYAITSKHLKKCFPDLKIGGPAISYIVNEKWRDAFFNWIVKENAPLDFFSWHIYTANPKYIGNDARIACEVLEKAGYHNTEKIISEFNYMENFDGQFIDSIEAIISERGAAFYAAAMCVGQKSPLDMLMYYDARPTALNGLFDDYTLRPLKGYYALRMFSELYKLGGEVISTADDENLYTAAAVKDGKAGAMICHYSVDKNATGKWVDINLDGLGDADSLRYYIVDKDYTMLEKKFNTEKSRIFMQPNSFVFISNYCIND